MALPLYALTGNLALCFRMRSPHESGASAEKRAATDNKKYRLTESASVYRFSSCTGNHQHPPSADAPERFDRRSDEMTSFVPVKEAEELRQHYWLH